jgi:UDP-N-acetyl-D-mannosaminuronic acid dehydrogenase
MGQKIKTVCVIGLGYIGLPTAVMIASSGMKALGVDIRQDIVDTLNKGGAHFSEPGLDELLDKVVADGSLRGFVEPQPADCFIIAVPTPFNGDHSPDLSYVDSAARSIAKVLRPGNLVILESTSPVGTTERVARILQEQNPEIAAPLAGNDHPNIHLAYCPERILPGQMMQELVNNDRIIGGMTAACTDLAKQVYGSFCNGELHGTQTRTAEMVKLAENSYRDLNIAFANELSMLCEKIDVEVWDAIKLANCHPRVNILSPGCGVGGHCIAVDPWFLIQPYPESTKLMRVARDTNDFKSQYVFEKIKTAAHRFKDPVIACLGLTYKPDVGDIRESPALHIANQLAAARLGSVLAVDPTLEGRVPGLHESIQLMPLEIALQKADIVAILVSHSAFKQLTGQALADRIVIDSVGLLH